MHDKHILKSQQSHVLPKGIFKHYFQNMILFQVMRVGLTIN